MKIVIDHLAGSRRGQRQEFAAEGRVTIGRHPESDVRFDAHRDLDASSRHAELRGQDGQVVLIDVGSSNGTFVGGSKVSEVKIVAGEPLEAEFGAGGPHLRIWFGEKDLAPEPVPYKRPLDARWVVIGLLVVSLVALLVRTLTR